MFDLQMKKSNYSKLEIKSNNKNNKLAENTSDFLIDLNNKFKFHRKNCKSSDYKEVKLKEIRNSRALYDHILFSTINRNKFKVYLKKQKDELLNKNKKLSESPVKNRLIVNLDNKHDKLSQNPINQDEHEKSNTLITSAVYPIKEKSNKNLKNAKIDFESEMIKTIYNNNLQEANIYSKINLIPITKTNNKNTATIDPNFFIMHHEKPVVKNKILNFIENPKLHKGRLLSFKCSENKTPIKYPQHFINEESISVNNLNYLKENKKNHSIFNKHNLISYVNSFNKFGGNSIKIRTDFKDIIFHSKNDEVYSKSNTIKNIIRDQIQTRCSYNNNKGSLVNDIPGITFPYKFHSKFFENKNKDNDKSCEINRNTVNDLSTTCKETKFWNNHIYKSKNIFKSDCFLDESEKYVLGYNKENLEN